MAVTQCRDCRLEAGFLKFVDCMTHISKRLSVHNPLTEKKPIELNGVLSLF
jgi:hypothetical protein